MTTADSSAASGQPMPPPAPASSASVDEQEGSVAKQEGSDAFRAGRYSDAFAHYTRGLASLLLAEDLALIDYGLTCPASVATPLTAETKPLATMLLTNRAAAALKLSPAHTFRALADSALALVLMPGPKQAFRRAQALLALGACTMAAEALRPHATADEPQLLLLLERAQQRDKGASHAAAALALQELTSVVPLPAVPPELAYLGPIAPRALAGAKKRGWVATARIEAGGLLGIERAEFALVAPPGGTGGDAEPSADDETRFPMLLSLVRRLSESTASEAEVLREVLGCLHPLRSANAAAMEPLTSRDTAVAARVAALTARHGLADHEATHIERVVQRNQMALKSRIGGELVHHGTGLFPLVSLTNHSCCPNATHEVLGGGCAMVMRATRTILPGEEVLIAYVNTSMRGSRRRDELLASYGFECDCERCAAPPGSAWYEMERDELALVCPACGAGKEEAQEASSEEGNPHRLPDAKRGLLPDSPYDKRASFRCAAFGCGYRLSAATASSRHRTAHASFVLLSAPLAATGEAERLSELSRRCRTAEVAESNARAILGRYHYEWGEWIAGAMQLAGDADDTALTLLACSKKEGMLASGRVAEEEDIMTRVNHAIVAGVDTADGVQAICSAFELDRARLQFGVAGEAAAASAGARSTTTGRGVDVTEEDGVVDAVEGVVASFVARWIPTEFEGLRDDVKPALHELYQKESAAAAAKRQKAQAMQARLAALGAARDKMIGRPPRLQPHDIPVITLHGSLTAEALRMLLANECCAVHVKGFIRSRETCVEIASRLLQRSEAFSNWRLTKAEAESANVMSEVDKIGVTSGNALDSVELFAEYLNASSPTRLDAWLPGDLNPFNALRASLEKLHTHGCRLNQLGGMPQPIGTFRRMRSSKGLIHADSVTLLESNSGQFSANIYVQTPAGDSGALSVYPAQQYAAADGRMTSPELMADLQSLALKQEAGFDAQAQQDLKAALPLQRTMHVSDGDLCLINTGRFHRVEPYNDPGTLRLNGQCWLSYKRGHALRMWV